MSLSLIQQELNKARKNLLELSTRNRLLSIPTFKRAKLVRVVDEKSDEIYRMLVEGKKKFTFLPTDQEDPNDESTQFDYDLHYPDEEESSNGEIADRHLDTQLQTTLTSKALQNRLLSIQLDAKTYIEDQGVNILYLGIGQLKWYEDENSDKERYAPLILIPVFLKRTSALARFTLEALEEESSENLSLGARLSEFGIKFPELTIEHDFKPSDYFRKVEDQIGSFDRWEVIPDAMVLGFFSFSKFLMYRDLDCENWPEDTNISNHPLVRGLLSEGFESSDELFPEDANIDEIISVERLSHVVDADSSQALAIEEIRKGKNLIIQGPPGTGKSQTITNIISTAVLDGKTVLFVAEKMAALDVVKRRLDEQGLSPIALELHSHKTNKKTFLEELKRTLNLGKPKVQDTVNLFSRLQYLRSDLNSHASRLNTTIQPSGYTPIEVIGNLSLIDSANTLDFVSLPNARKWTRTQKQEIESLIADLSEKHSKLGDADSNIWRGVRLQEQILPEREAVFEMIDECIPKIVSIKNLSELVSEKYHLPKVDNLAHYKRTVWAANYLHQIPEFDKDSIKSSTWLINLEELKALVDLGQNLSLINGEIESLLIDSIWAADLNEVRQTIAAHGSSIFRVFNKSYRDALAKLKGYLKNPKDLPKKFEKRLAFIDQILEGQSLRMDITRAESLARESFGKLWDGINSQWEKLSSLVEWIVGLKNNNTSKVLRNAISQIDIEALDQCQTAQLQTEIETVSVSLNNLFVRLNLDLECYFESEEIERIEISKCKSLIESWVGEVESFISWTRYWARVEQANEEGLNSIISILQADPSLGTVLSRVLSKSYFRELYNQIVEEVPEFRKFDGESHDRLVNEFRENDRKRIDIARYETLKRHYQDMPSQNGAVGAMGTVRSEIAKKRRHMAIRKLIEHAGGAIKAIKPVFMMSPLSVAKFLEAGKIDFDLVVFDEASQVKPVDAIGTIARGKQLVVVGDSKQLPPSSFFSKIDITDDEDVDDETDLVPIASAGNMESILTLSESRGLRSRMLRWHYRSRHSSLIAVSNLEFYGSNLYIVPSPLSNDPEFGLKFNHVTNGRYDSGKSATNRIEAKTVAEAAINHARIHPNDSLGIAAFSVKQRDAIRDELELLRRQNSELEPFFESKHPHEPFFIKNLENIQGDERDVIFISVGYGKNLSNAMPSMHFGPINKDGGERRLNVLISRSKKRCEVFASIRSDEIDLNRSNKAGVKALKTFLKYAETGILGVEDSNTAREMDSPFEESVKRAIEGEGYIVDTQVGVAGFYIDLAVRDLKNPGRYILGVECDGATYHSSRSARERDRQREGVLVDHGWSIHRVWSTDWFDQPKKQLSKIVHAIENESAITNIQEADELVRTEISREKEVIEEESLAIPYSEIQLDLPHHGIESISYSRMIRIVESVVNHESPIHGSELVTRIREGMNYQKAGSSIRNKILGAAKYAQREGMIKQEGDFFLALSKKVAVRDRCKTSSASLRKSDMISPQEISKAICQVVSAYHGVSKGDLATSVAPLFGLNRTSAAFKQRIFEISDSLVQSEKLHLEGELLTYSRK